MATVSTAEVPVFPTFKGFRSKVTAEVDGAGKESGGRFSSAFGGAIAGIGAGIGAIFAGLKVKDYFIEGIKGASALEQSVGAVSAIFKDSAGQINAWSDSAATDVGLTKNDFNELGTLIGAQLKNGGTAMDELAPKTNQLIGLGADLSSMFGGDTRSAVEALSSALKGERDPIEKYGVSLNQAKIDAEAAALGFEKVGGTLSAEANQAATLSLIMKQTADAHGNFASEADTVAGKQQRLNALWQDGKVKIASAFLPAVGAISGFLADKLPGAITIAEGAIGSIIARGTELWKGLTAPPGVDSSAGGLVGFGTVVRDVFTRIGEAVGPFFAQIKNAFATGDFSGFQDAFSGFMAVAQPAGPILAQVGGSIGQLSGSIGEVVAGALPLLTPLLEGAAAVMNFLAENTGVLTGVIIALAGGFVIYKAAQAAANIAALAAVPVAVAETASRFALAAATRAQTAATVGSTAATTVSTTAERASLGSRLASTAATVRQGIATGAAKVATLASAAATGVAAAAQTVWATATNGSALASARAAVSTVAARVAMAAGAVATGIATAAQWAFNAALTANPIGIIIALIVALVAGLVYFFTQTELGKTVWAEFTRFLGEAWANIVAVATTVFTALADFFTTIWNAIWNGIVSFISGVVGTVAAAIAGMVNGVSAGVQQVLGFISGLPGQILGFLGNLGGILFNSGQSLIQGFINGIKAMIGKVGAAVRGVMDFVGGFFPNSPAKRGPFSGAGWRNLKSSGGAIGEQLASGISASNPAISRAMSSLLMPAAQASLGARTGSRYDGPAGGESRTTYRSDTFYVSQAEDPVFWARRVERVRARESVGSV